jgi:hypothetical protein
MRVGKDKWPFELECMRKAVNGGIDGYQIEISRHYENDRFEQRGYTRIDIALAIFNGTIIEGYSSVANRKRTSNQANMIAPSRVILGKDSNGDWLIVVVALWSSKNFHVATCYFPGARQLELLNYFYNKL